MKFQNFFDRLHRSKIASWRWWINAVTAPVTRSWGLFSVMILLLTLVPVAYYFFRKPQLIDSLGGASIQMLAEAVIASWCLLALYHICRKVHKAVGIVWLVIAFFLLVANCAIDLVMMLIYNCSFTSDIAAVIMATNPSEGSDFVHTYANSDFLLWSGVILVSSGIIFSAGVYLRRYLSTRLNERAKLILRTVTLIILFSSLGYVVWGKDSIVSTTNFRHKIYTFATIDLGHDLVPANPSIIHDSTAAPQKIVVIIGESLNRSHCSLYGYEKPTQPHLESMCSDSSLYVFREPVSPAVSTMTSLQRIIGTWNGEEENKWYECPTFIEIARLSGYRVSWISNQASKGIYDNPVVKIAEFCDRHRFTNDGMYGVVSGEYDEALIPLAEDWIDSKKELTIIHLMGNHVSYSHRYPTGYDQFKALDYNDLPEHQRQTIADYDNSVLYNDYVVSQLMKLYTPHDAVVIYISDHAQDLYESDPNFFGHARSDEPQSAAAGKAVPLLVYMSPLFQERHPETASMIAHSTENRADLTNLTYALMKLMHTRFTDNNDVERYSFFR